MASETDPLGQLSAAGVAVWLDDLSRERLRTGSLADLIRDRHVVGVTTNPTIFQKAISGATPTSRSSMTSRRAASTSARRCG